MQHISRGSRSRPSTRTREISSAAAANAYLTINFLITESNLRHTTSELPMIRLFFRFYGIFQSH